MAKVASGSGSGNESHKVATQMAHVGITERNVSHNHAAPSLWMVFIQSLKLKIEVLAASVPALWGHQKGTTIAFKSAWLKTRRDFAHAASNKPLP